MRERSSRALRSVCFALLSLASTALGLDPGKSLTQYAHRVWQQEQGLPQPTIYTITQTHDGYLWLGLQGRLARFDGVRFTEFDGAPGAPLGNNPIRALFEDSQHTLWIGSSGGGLTRLIGGVFSRVSGLPDDTVNCILRAPGGGLWLCTSNGLVNFSGERFTVSSTDRGLPTGHLRTAVLDRRGALTLGGEDFGLAVWNGSRFFPVSGWPSPERGVQALLRAADGSLWVGTPSGLFRWKDGRLRSWTSSDGLPANSVLSLAEGGDGSLWIGTAGGLARLKDGEFTSFQARDGLSHSTVLALFRDREGSLWAGTKNGLNQFLDGRVTPYTTTEGLPSNNLGPVFEDHAGRLWIGTRDAGLVRFDGRRFRVLTTRQGLASNAVFSLAEDRAGNLWVGTAAGLNRLRGGRVEATYTTRQGLPANRISSLFRDSRGVLWVGTSKGLGRLTAGSFEPAPPDAGLDGKTILSLGGGVRVELFVAAADGVLTYLKDGRFQRAPGDAVRPLADSFCADPDHVLWAGTLGGGLRRYQDGKVTVYSVRDGLFDDEIYAVLLDDDNNLWMASSKGIFRTSKRELDEFAAGRRKSVSSYPLSTGEVRFECRAGVEPVACKTRDGRLWFSTDNGLILVDPHRLRRDAQPPPVLIRDVLVNNRATGLAGLGALRPRENNLQFLYASLSFLAPERVTFRYFLEGYDKSWSDARNTRFASYTNLPPGRFRFHVTACNGDGVCNARGSAVDLYIVPYLYQRRWFYPALAALLALLVWLAYQLRIRRMENQFTLVLAERTRIARELHDTLIQGLSSITMQMQALSNRMAASPQKLTLDDIIHDAGTCLKEARKSLWGLRSPSSAGELSARLAAMARRITEGHPVRLHLDLDPHFDPVPVELESHLLSIAQEALLNAVLHASAGAIEVVARRLPERITLLVADDGRGFSADAPPPPGHYGLLGIRERVAELGGELELESEPGRGTKLRVAVPAPKIPARVPRPAYADHQSSLR